MEDTRRNQIIDIVERELIGPDPVPDLEIAIQKNGQEILLTDPPLKRYLAGILFPRGSPEGLADSAVDGNEDGTEENFADEGELAGTEEKAQDPGPPDDQVHLIRTGSRSGDLEEAEEMINCSNAFNPSAFSLTAAVYTGDTLTIRLEAGTYTKEVELSPETGKPRNRYLRSQIIWTNDDNPLTLSGPQQRVIRYQVPATFLQFDVTWRYAAGACSIYTFTMENLQEDSSEHVPDEKCYFQAKFILYSKKGFAPLLDGARITEDEDYRSNQLLYRDVHSYATGHGCSADWQDTEPVFWVSTAVFPRYILKPIEPAALQGVSLEMKKMGPEGSFQDALAELNIMCKEYEKWIKGRQNDMAKLPQQYLETATRHISNCQFCLERMKQGVNLLEQDPDIRTAFQYMNLAMLMQQLHYKMPLQSWEIQNGVLSLPNPVRIPDVNDEGTWYYQKNQEKQTYGKWRPFQLAFILMNLGAMKDPSTPEREIVDLIWFPTGGGKTEAYLGLSAYTIFLRRLLNRNDRGTVILMRYTLRLLTAQQYERASSLICSCEWIRDKHPELFGGERISIGLWVGTDTTPNTMNDATEAYNKLYKNGTQNPFVILKCPWCGAQMGPVSRSNYSYTTQKGQKPAVIRTRGGKNKPSGNFLPGYKKEKEGPSWRIFFQCANKDCYYSTRELPLYVIDDEIYQKAPTLLLGTVDKFAMLPFRPKAQILFGFHNGVHETAPSLIIQDELHLISGPLGSMVGHYETMIQELCTIRNGDQALRPKIITSTATISRAKEQCHALYGCTQDQVFQFPPSGLEAKDSFFAVEAKSGNGRQYVGILCDGNTSDDTKAIRLLAALLYAGKALTTDDESKRDPYWTNVAYFNSLRELGTASSWVESDIKPHLDIMYKRRFLQKNLGTKEYRDMRRYASDFQELTSRIPGSAISSTLAKLYVTYPPEHNEEGKVTTSPIDICFATNMISVGLDVPRLGLMTVMGQPKTTSEYIQATSRVGRIDKAAPGLVFVLYRPGRVRDKSHYEQFKRYHSRIYCNVEPTSVTPFSSPVRRRALHAILIGLIRMQSENKYNAGKPELPSREMLDRVVNIITQRISDIDPEELQAAKNQIENDLFLWESWKPEVWSFEGKSKTSSPHLPLLYYAGKPARASWGDRGFPTPSSMRNVDATCKIVALSRYTDPKEEE